MFMSIFFFLWCDQSENLRLKKKILKINCDKISKPINSYDFFVWPYGHTDFGLTCLPLLGLTRIVYFNTIN